MKTNDSILLESGTNELEIVVFRVDEVDAEGETVPCYFGVNVAKVREIIRLPHLYRGIKASESIEGMIKLRDKVITVINLAKVLNKNTGDLKSEHVIVLEFNAIVIAVMVHAVSRIYRISWERVEPPARLVDDMYVTGVVKMDNFIILLLDFEKIIGEICCEDVLNKLGDEQMAGENLEFDRGQKKILIVDDSPFIRHTLSSSLRSAGYCVEEADNGEAAWLAIGEKIQRCRAGQHPITNELDLIITDVEMPRMDGLHLTTLVRGEADLQRVPLVIFSSLATEDNKRKWRSLGADDILTKPDLPNLVKVVDNLIQLKKAA